MNILIIAECIIVNRKLLISLNGFLCFFLIISVLNVQNTKIMAKQRTVASSWLLSSVAHRDQGQSIQPEKSISYHDIKWGIINFSSAFKRFFLKYWAN